MQYGAVSQSNGIVPPPPPPPAAFNNGCHDGGGEAAIREPIYPCGVARARFPANQNQNGGNSQMELLKQVRNEQWIFDFSTG